MSGTNRNPSDGYARLPVSSVVVSGILFGFFGGSAIVLLHPVFLALVSGGSWQIHELLMSSLRILPATMAVSLGLGAICGICWVLARRVLPKMNMWGQLARVVWSAWSVALCLGLMLVYDAEIFKRQWSHVIFWGVIAVVLAAISDALRLDLLGWLRQGDLKRLLALVLFPGLLMCLFCLLCFMLP